MKVEITSCVARNSQDIAVTFKLSEGDNSCSETFLVSHDQFVKMKLSVGESDRETYQAASEGAELHFAMKKGLASLAYGASSKGNLAKKLEGKGVKREVAEAVCRELERKGYINDGREALREAELAVGKLWGKRRIAAELYRKGYDEESVRSAIYSLEDSGVDFCDMCAELIRRKYGCVPEEPGERQKLYAALTRYGYSSSDISLALETVRDES